MCFAGRRARAAQGSFVVPDLSRAAVHSGVWCNVSGQNVTLDCPYGAAVHNCSETVWAALPNGANATLALPYTFDFACPERAPACRYWDASAKGWSGAGCVLQVMRASGETARVLRHDRVSEQRTTATLGRGRCVLEAWRVGDVSRTDLSSLHSNSELTLVNCPGTGCRARRQPNWTRTNATCLCDHLSDFAAQASETASTAGAVVSLAGMYGVQDADDRSAREKTRPLLFVVSAPPVPHAHRTRRLSHLRSSIVSCFKPLDDING